MRLVAAVAGLSVAVRNGGDAGKRAVDGLHGRGGEGGRRRGFGIDKNRLR